MGGGPSTVTSDVTCSECKGIIKDVTKHTNSRDPYINPCCEQCASAFNTMERKGVVCRACGEAKLVPKETNTAEGFLCPSCAMIARRDIEKKLGGNKNVMGLMKTIQN